jgi:hypothetical protein
LEDPSKNKGEDFRKEIENKLEAFTQNDSTTETEKISCAKVSLLVTRAPFLSEQNTQVDKSEAHDESRRDSRPFRVRRNPEENKWLKRTEKLKAESESSSKESTTGKVSTESGQLMLHNQIPIQSETEEY